MKKSPSGRLLHGRPEERAARLQIEIEHWHGGTSVIEDPTASRPLSPNSICTCTAKAICRKPGTPSARICRRSTALRACASPSGRRTRRIVSVTGDFQRLGYRAAIRCACAPAASGRFSSRARKDGDSYKYHRAVASFSATSNSRPIRSDFGRRSRRSPRRSSAISTAMSMERWRMDGLARRAAMAEGAGLDLRSCISNRGCVGPTANSLELPSSSRSISSNT